MALTSISYLILLNLTWVKKNKKKLSSKDLHYVQTNPITLHLNNSNFRRDLKYLIFLFLYFIFFIRYFSNTLLILYETETFALCVQQRRESFILQTIVCFNHHEWLIILLNIQSDQLLKSSLREHGWELVEENEGNVITIK